MICLAYSDFVSLGYGNYQAKLKAYNNNVKARQALVYNVFYSLKLISVGLKLIISKRKSTRLY
jgi:hypothetical protein